MKTFYSIVYALITPETGEKISLGILLSDGENSIFRYSRLKLSIVHSMVSAEQGKFMSDYLHSLSKLSNPKNTIKVNLGLKFAESGKSLISESYIEYLSVYNQNILTYSKPVLIEMEVSTEATDILFRKLINEKGPDLLNPAHKLAIVRNEFVQKVKEYYSIDRELTRDEYSTLIMPVKIDLLGKNERPVFAKFFDFERQVNYIKNDFFDLTQLQEALTKPKGFIVSFEPENAKYPIQHQAWEDLRSNKKTEYLDASEIDKIQEYAEVHGVVPV